ncbi:MAG: hypothetical protein IPM69_10580 [Ignavibacteria bacterium]|nr:hypothetical protein [Ignavibacteria bacterium]
MNVNELPNFDALWNYSKPEETEQKFREILSGISVEDHTEYYASLLTQIARTLGLQMKFDEAHKTLNEVEKLIDESMIKARVRLMLERGRAFRSSGSVPQSIPCFEQAYSLASTSRELDYFAVDAAHMMGIVMPPDGGGLEWNEKACHAAEESSDKNAQNWLGALYNNIGWTYHAKGEYRIALGWFEKYAAWSAARMRTTDERIAKWCAAKMRRLLGEVREALAYQLELLEILEAINEPDGYVFEEIGECLLALDRAVEAAPHFQAAYELLSQDAWLVRDEQPRIERLKMLGMPII